MEEVLIESRTRSVEKIKTRFGLEEIISCGSNFVVLRQNDVCGGGSSGWSNALFGTVGANLLL